MIEIHEVTKRYGSTVAVDGLSVEVRTGEVPHFDRDISPADQGPQVPDESFRCAGLALGRP